MIGSASAARADESLFAASTFSDDSMALNGAAYTGATLRLRGGDPYRSNVASSAVTPLLDTMGFDSVALCFRARVQRLDVGESASVGYSTDGGASYNTLSFSPSGSWSESCFELAGAANQRDLLVAWWLVADSIGELFEIDDVTVTGLDGTGGSGGGGGIIGGGGGGGIIGGGGGGGGIASPQQLRGNGPYSAGNYQLRSTSGFGGATIWYPRDAPGPRGAVVTVSGFLAPGRDVEWVGRLLSTWGFVVAVIETNSPFDDVSSRARQLRAAVEAVIDEGESRGSPISGMVDDDKLALVGWSMGGGAAAMNGSNREIDAIVPMAPYTTGVSTSGIRAPALVVSCENDIVAGSGRGLYNSIRAEKAFLEINGGSHQCVTSSSPDRVVIGQYMIAWLKRFLDGQTGYNSFLCDRPSDRDISDYEASCPL